MSKHTPGPWHYAECQMGAPFIDTESVRDLFAAALPLDEERANVRLMSAERDLLAAVEVLLAAVARRDHKDKALRTARAAIAKAKGETP